MAVETTYRKAKLWNRGKEDFSYSVKGEKVHIPAGKSITVSRRKALDIKGYYPGKGTMTMLEIEPIFEDVVVPEDWVDHKTGKSFQTREALLRHLGVEPMLASVPKGFECVICAADFKSKDELVAHLAECVKKNQPKSEATTKK